MSTVRKHLLSPIKHGEICSAALVALAINYSEQIYDACEPESEEIFNRLLVDALEEKGYKGLSIDAINKSIAQQITGHARIREFPTRSVAGF